MYTTLHNAHEAVVSVHGIEQIEVTANAMLRDDGSPLYWQELRFRDGSGLSLGRVTLFLERPEVALPVGSLPPYWGLDLGKPLGLLDGDAPF